MSDDLSRLEPWLAGLTARLTPAQRRQLARRIGQQLRRSNAERVRRNVEPDGGAMEPRKPRVPRKADEKQGRVRNKGRMFRRIALARNLRVDAQPDQVEVGFVGAVQRTARVHHHGLRDRVARFRGAPEIRYAERRLIGFGPDDREAIMEAALAHLQD